MRRIAAIISLLCLSCVVFGDLVWAAPPTLSDRDVFYGSEPDDSARHWIRLASFARPTTVSRPIIFFSPYAIKNTYPHVWFRLSGKQYSALVRLSQCHQTFPRGREMEMVEYSNWRRGEDCYLGPAEACKYLDAVMKSPEIGLPASTRKFLREWIGYSFEPSTPCYAALPRNIQR
jgi:hypothetical protein